MGLDGVEPVMAFEDDFNVRIPDKVAGEMVTVGDTVRYLVGQLTLRKLSDKSCSTARSFYRLRRELMIRYGTARSAVRLDVPIGELIPSNARHDWPGIAELSHLRTERKWFFRVLFPNPEASLRSLIQQSNKTPWVRIDGSIDEEAVFHRIQQIMAEQMDISESEINRESRYIQDLGTG